MYIENKEIGFIESKGRMGFFGYEVLNETVEVVENIIAEIIKETLNKIGYKYNSVEVTYNEVDEDYSHHGTIYIEIKDKNEEIYFLLTSLYPFETNTIIFKDDKYKVFTFYQFDSYSITEDKEGDCIEDKILEKLFSDYSL